MFGFGAYIILGAFRVENPCRVHEKGFIAHEGEGSWLTALYRTLGRYKGKCPVC